MVGLSGVGQCGWAGQDLRFAERGAGRSASDPHKSCAFFQDDWIDLHGKTVGEVRRRGQASEARRCFYPVEYLPGLSSLKFSWSLGDLKSKLVPFLVRAVQFEWTGRRRVLLALVEAKLHWMTRVWDGELPVKLERQKSLPEMGECLLAQVSRPPIRERCSGVLAMLVDGSGEGSGVVR